MVEWPKRRCAGCGRQYVCSCYNNRTCTRCREHREHPVVLGATLPYRTLVGLLVVKRQAERRS